MSEPTIGVIGLGLIGGSIARGLVPSHKVVGYDSDAQTRQSAEHAGIAIVDSVAEVGAADIIFLATPLRAMAETLQSLAATVADRDEVIVTDVGSVKVPVQQWVDQAGLTEKFILGHPMAGTEFTGFENADPILLNGATWALCITDQTDLDRWLIVASLLTKTFHSRVVTPTPEDHDRAAAMISHMPHVIATAALNLLDSPEAALASAMAAGSFTSLTRVAGTNAQRTEAMVSENAKETAAQVAALAATLQEFSAALAAGKSLTAFFEQASRVREGRASTTGTSTMRLPDDSSKAQAMLIDLARSGREVLGIDGSALSVTDAH